MRTDLYDRQLKKYTDERINMLEKHFKISLSKAEKKHFHELTTEIAVDNFFRSIIRKKL